MDKSYFLDRIISLIPSFRAVSQDEFISEASLLLIGATTLAASSASDSSSYPSSIDSIALTSVEVTSVSFFDILSSSSSEASIKTAINI
jgi:hypothetical protein